MYYDEEHKYKEKARRDRKIRKFLVLTILVLIGLLAIGIAIIYHFFRDDTDEGVIPAVLEQETYEAEVTFTESQLQDILETSELSTASYTYNSIVSAYAEDGVTVRYHVSYEGVIKAGVDFSDIIMKIDNESKTISLTLPEVQVMDMYIDAGTLDYIFVSEKYNIATVSQEAYNLSCSDLESKIANEEQLYVTARENAVAAVEALIKPWVEQVDEDYTVSIE
ncbi:MAG: DUF4230 domain-containing protein [Ruminococcus sp.]|nr:DUF4230 domain-containing protein [Ruminococcus sp.]